MRRGADYLDYWQRRHADSGNTSPPPFAVGGPNGFLAPSIQTIQYLEPKGEDMTPSDETTSESKTSRMIRRAILHELHQPLGPDEPPPTYKLEAFVRAIVDKASQGDMTAAKAILDRLAGRTPTVAPPSADFPNDVLITWKPPV
jgi:hypothetical protein